MIDNKENDWFKEGIQVDFDDEEDDGNNGILVVKLPKELRSKFIKPWRNALIIKIPR